MTLYLCDPEKNAECSKRGCKSVSGGDSYRQCELTSNPDCAKLDADGKPITVEVQQDADGNPVITRISGQATQEDTDRFRRNL